MIVNLSRYPAFRLLFFVLVFSFQSPNSLEAARPNILFILSDDQRSDQLGCAGHPVLRTPRIDRLAAEGVRFENAFVTSPICAASRASFLTGLYERTHGFTFNEAKIDIANGASSYPALLKKAGYRSGYIGKVHAKFENEKETFAQMFDWFRPVSSKQYLVEQADGQIGHETELCGDRAVEFIKSNVEGQPFVLSVCFFAAHAVDRDHRLGHHYESLPELKSMYGEDAVPDARLAGDAERLTAPVFLREGMNRERWGWRWDTKEKFESNMRDFYRVVSGIDLTVARILDTLEAEGLSENTIVVYASDNGNFMGDRGMAGKWNHYDQALRVPLIVYDPRLPVGQRGRVLDEFALNVDVAPTLLDYAGLDPDPSYQGVSLKKLVDGADVGPWRDSFYCEHLMKHAKIPSWVGVRSRDYKYAVYPNEGEGGYECLYDLNADPDELVNLAADASAADVLIGMRDQLKAYQARIPARPHAATRVSTEAANPEPEL